MLVDPRYGPRCGAGKIVAWPEHACISWLIQRHGRLEGAVLPSLEGNWTPQSDVRAPPSTATASGGVRLRLLPLPTSQAESSHKVRCSPRRKRRNQAHTGAMQALESAASWRAGCSRARPFSALGAGREGTTGYRDARDARGRRKGTQTHVPSLLCRRAQARI